MVFGVSPTRYYFPEHFLGIPNDKIRFLPIGADTDFADKLIQNINTKNSSTIKGNPLFCFSIRWKMDKKKKLDVLLNAKKEVDAKLVVFGKILDQKLEKMLKKMKNVEFLGWQNRKGILNLFLTSDIAIWPSLHITLLRMLLLLVYPYYYTILRYYISFDKR